MKAITDHPAGGPERRGPSPFRAVGLRVTRQREAILRVLEGSDPPLSAEEILGRMQGFPTGVPTVYRNLRQFVGQGWVEPVIGSDKALRFIRCRSARHHHHILCEHCGKMAEVDVSELGDTLDAFAEQSGFRITRHLLQWFGLCPECQTHD